MNLAKKVGRLALLIAGVIAVTGVSYVLFFRLPSTPTELGGITLIILAVTVGTIVVSKLVNSAIPGHNVGKITIDGTIAEGESSNPLGGSTVSASEVVDEIEAADDADNVKGLIVKLNTGGGGIIPSENIRLALEKFDGPTIAYATEVCASGGCWIAAGCDEVWVRRASMVGSIGVKFSQFRVNELADKIGVSYESITTAEYKEIMTPYKELEEHEREHLQTIADTFHDLFIDRMSKDIGLDKKTLKETEARVFIGEKAVESGLADNIGTKTDVKERMEDRLGVEVVVDELGDSSGVLSRVRGEAHTLAYTFGAGLGSSVRNATDSRFEF